MRLDDIPRRTRPAPRAGFLRRVLRWQLALLIVSGLALIWVLVGLELRHLDAIAERESKRDVHNLSHAFAEEVNATVSTIDLSLIGLRSHWERNRAEFPTLVSTLQRLLEDKVIFQVAVTDASGVMVFSSADAQARGLDLSDREHIRIHLDRHVDALHVSKPVLGRVSKKWSIQFTRPVYTLDGKFDGVIVASVAPAYFSRFFSHIDLGDGAALGLVRSDGTILARSPNQDEGRGIGVVLHGQPFDQTDAEPDGLYRRLSQVDGVERFFAWRTLPRYGLVVLIGQASKDAYARFAEQRMVYLEAGIGLSVVFVLLAVVLVGGARQRRRTLRALTEAEARWKFALEGSGEGVWDWDLVKQRAQLSKRAAALLQVDAETIPCNQETLDQMVHPDDVALVNKAMQSHFDEATPSYVAEHRVRARDGGWAWILSRGMVVKRALDGTPLRVVGTFSDIHDRKAREEYTRYLAQHDVLTGLPNRSLFTDRLQQALLRAQRDGGSLAVIYFDLDRFKPVNDSYGHETGDKLLAAVAARVRACLRESDTVARMGGDEFAILLPNVTAEADAARV
ncbi:diguanylate cyclase, partial [Oxalobacteraceae bacterium OM1]